MISPGPLPRASSFRVRPALAGLIVLLVTLGSGSANGDPVWGQHGGGPQHTSLSSVASQPLQQILWQTPVDLNPQYSGTDLFIHYGSPLVTAMNTIIVPVKVGAADTFRVEARVGRTGMPLWQEPSDYTLPVAGWIPSYTPALTPSGRLYLPAAGGTLLYADQIDGPETPTFTRIAFYGTANYVANPAAYADVKICSPLTIDALGNVYFGFMASGANPLGIRSGIARIGADGSGAYVTAKAASAAHDSIPLMNCAPALSNDGHTLYVTLTSASDSGELVALDAATLATVARTPLTDPLSANPAVLLDIGSGTPMVGPDGRIFFGVLENPFPSNADRGWMLQFNPDLSPAGAPGAFGWDDTPSIVPRAIVPSYTGPSSYLLMTKYNNYAGFSFGNGVNKIAILDPNVTQTDPFTGAAVMKEILTMTGVTPDSEYTDNYPNAVREWCINAAAVDTATHSVLAGSEDGRLYRWDLAANTFSESVTLTPGVGEAYTPTVIGGDGRVYAINNATLFSVGRAGTAAVPAGSQSRLDLAVAGPDPFTGATALRLSLPSSSRVKLEILDTAGRHLVTLAEGAFGRGERIVRWDGRDSAGRMASAGVYYARLTSGAASIARKLVLTR